MAASREAMRRVGLTGEPESLVVTGEAEARLLGFRGSPTVTIDGMDAGDTPEGEPGSEWG